MAFPTGRFVWFEYVSKDATNAQRFFGELFNWKTQTMAVPSAPGGVYTMIAIDSQMIGGYIGNPEGSPPQAHWLTHLQVSDATATAAKIRSIGGKVRKDAVKMGEMGTWAVVADPTDATFAIWQPAKAEDNEFKGINGSWCWNELMTTDPDKAVAFYKQLGFDGEDTMEMAGGAGTYHVLKSSGKQRAGIMKTMKPGMPSGWTPYVQVASADQTLDKGKRLGATILMPLETVPNVGRVAVLTDPQGVKIGILQPNR